MPRLCSSVSAARVERYTYNADFSQRTAIDEYPVQGRGGKGIISVKTTEKNGLAVGFLQVRDSDQIMLMAAQGKVLRCKVGDIREIGRNTQGVRILDLGDRGVEAHRAEARHVIVEPGLPPQRHGFKQAQRFVLHRQAAGERGARLDVAGLEVDGVPAALTTHEARGDLVIVATLPDRAQPPRLASLALRPVPSAVLQRAAVRQRADELINMARPFGLRQMHHAAAITGAGVSAMNGLPHAVQRVGRRRRRGCGQQSRATPAP